MREKDKKGTDTISTPGGNQQLAIFNEILNELRTLNRNFERLFSQGHVVDPVSEAVQTRELEFRQFQHDMQNAPDEATRRKIRKAWNDRRKMEDRRKQ